MLIKDLKGQEAFRERSAAGAGRSFFHFVIFQLTLVLQFHLVSTQTNSPQCVTWFTRSDLAQCWQGTDANTGLLFTITFTKDS